ncbi:hypothetical protein [Actinomadura hibisca]|uniref:hypothetical protein n=1 Tax=Actinomadura hibisca TaxID=68565 RepID=UPI000829FD18|nr:hypothetical protein [Actinomadura hibisca]
MTGGIAGAPAADPEMRITAHVFERAHGAPCTTLRRAHGALTLLAGPGTALAVALPWGTIVAAGPGEDGTAGLYSMNRHADAFSMDQERLAAALAAGTMPPWAVPAVRALLAHADPMPGARLVVNRELPVETGLLSGAETACAATATLGDLYGAARAATSYETERDPSHLASLHARDGHAALVTDGTVRHLPCDLLTAGLRLLIMDVGLGGENATPAISADLVEQAAGVLQTGDLDALGPLLTQSHIRGEPLLDEALDIARSAGALGGLALGRCGLALVPVAAVPDVRTRVVGRLAGRARRRPRFLTVVPSGV